MPPMASSPVRRWLIGAPFRAMAPDQGEIVLHTGQSPPPSGERSPLLFHDVMASPETRDAAEVDVWPPPFRGKSMIRLLAHLISSRLAGSATTARWHLDRQQGPDSVARMLRTLGWQDVTKERDGRAIVVQGR